VVFGIASEYVGPITVFDKSFLQSLSVDESVFFDHFFNPVITPLFFVETLADLEKAVRQGRTPEQEVGMIALKAPEASSYPIIHHTRLALANLMGVDITMDGRPLVDAGVPVKVDGKKGVRHDVAPETVAFNRWQAGEFIEVEREFAKTWRQDLANIDLTAVAAAMKAMGIDGSVCKTLADAKRIATQFVERTDIVPNQIKLAFIILGLPPHLETQAGGNWVLRGMKPLAEYAPYAAHVMIVELFFQIALGAGLIGTLASNRADIAYLYYTPFCMVFVSSDKLHRRTVPEFLRSNQSCVWGQDLKADLHRVMEHYSKLPDEVRELGLMRIAPVPPVELADSLVVQLWDRHMASHWRSISGMRHPRDPMADAEIIAEMNRFSEARPLTGSEIDFEPADVDMVQLRRSVHKLKGNWFQLPKDLKEKLD
jgi:hypothetical protein